jgi:phosphatidylglycerophosphatase A
VLLSLVAVWACSQSEKHFGRRDPREAILDEVAGQQIALLGLPLMGETALALLVSGWKYIGAAFILFRIFDVVKPFPIRRVERLSGGWGMVADDLLAGGLSFLVLWIGRKLGL